jgi:hypothetical protein
MEAEVYEDIALIPLPNHKSQSVIRYGSEIALVGLELTSEEQEALENSNSTISTEKAGSWIREVHWVQ